MKLKRSIVSLSILGATAMLYSFTSTTEQAYNDIDTDVVVKFPEAVKKIIDDRCYGCHNTESRGKKSKKKLNFDHFNGKYSKTKMISKLGKIGEVLKEKEMPPENFLAKYPDKNITAEESIILSKWATEQRSVLMGK